MMRNKGSQVMIPKRIVNKMDADYLTFIRLVPSVDNMPFAFPGPACS